MASAKSDATSVDSPDALRHALVDELRERGSVRSVGVEAALRSVPRHTFVPAVPPRQAYANDVVPTKHDHAGRSISAASQPSIVALMLEQADIRPRQRILEIGAGTGYNAALLAHLAGEDGSVTTIDVDADIVDGARSALAAGGYGTVDVVLGDGARGVPARAPYDLVMATVGAWDIPAAWLDQLAPDGRLVVPQRVRGGVSRSIVYTRDGPRWRGIDSTMCGFMPLRAGIAADPYGAVPLTVDGTVSLDTYQEQEIDPEALACVLDQPRTESRTGTFFTPAESLEWMWLWLACALDNTLVRMTAQPVALDRGLVTAPLGGWLMATTRAGTLAYVALLDPARGNPGRRNYEVTVIGHGPGRRDLVDHVVEQIRCWNSEHREQSVDFVLQTRAIDEPLAGQFVFDMPHTRLAVSWR